MVVYKVVGYRRWSLTRSGRYERVDCISCFSVITSWVAVINGKSNTAPNPQHAICGSSYRNSLCGLM